MSPRLLVVDDEPSLVRGLTYALERERFEVDVATDGRAAVDVALSQSFDLILLDVMLPKLSGADACREIRAESDVPIIMLTARSSETDLVLGFEAGADDYVAKPFSVHELVSRARAILRRRRLDEGARSASVSVGDVELDLLRHEVRIGGRSVRLTPTEYRLLVKLAESDRAFGRRELLQAAWDTDFVPDPRSCDVHVANLRRKVEDDPADPTRVLTVRGVGYRLAR
jgi:DNA-binding response OmpR family regulator